jgi:hypothetical protein
MKTKLVLIHLDNELMIWQNRIACLAQSLAEARLRIAKAIRQLQKEENP